MTLLQSPLRTAFPSAAVHSQLVCITLILPGSIFHVRMTTSTKTESSIISL